MHPSTVPHLRSEKSLRELSTSFKDVFPNDGSTLVNDGKTLTLQLQSVLDDLIATADCPAISTSHRIGACSTLSGFIETCLRSRHLAVRQLAFSRDVEEKLFSIYLHWSVECQVKPVRRLLACLASIILMAPDSENELYIRAYLLRTILASILQMKKDNGAKPACQALDFFLKRNAISVEDIARGIHAFTLSQNTTTKSCTATIAQVASSLGEDVLDCWSASVETFTLAGLECMAEPDMGAAAGQMLATFFASVYHKSSDSLDFYHSTNNLPCWAAPVKMIACDRPDIIEFLQRYLLSKLLKIERNGFIMFIKSLPFKVFLSNNLFDSSSPECLLLLAALQIGQEHGLVVEDGNTSHELVVPGNVFDGYLAHISPTVRFMVLSILISSAAITRPVSKTVLGIIKKYLPFLHADTDAKFRNDVLSLSRKLVLRLRASTLHLVKLREQCRTADAQGLESNDTCAEGALLEQAAFCSWYVEFLTSEIRPTASYQRRIVALKALSILNRVHTEKLVHHSQLPGQLVWLPDLRIFQPALIRMLLDLTMDPFEDVRDLSATLLLSAPFTLLYSTQNSTTLKSEHSMVVPPCGDGVTIILETLLRAEKVMRQTGRADHSDGVARLYFVLLKRCESSVSDGSWWCSTRGIINHILELLEAGVSLALTDLRAAVASAPIPGYLIALRYAVSQPDFYLSVIRPENNGSEVWKDLHTRIARCSQDIWRAMRDILCIDSPEGQLDDQEENLDIGAKDTLSFSWRAVKESSCLLQSLVVNPTYGPPHPHGLDLEDYSFIGRLCFTQLAELRHRGAFSTVSASFASCCQVCVKSSDVHISRLPRIWYKDTLDTIQEQATKLTRRSAGLPALITGILSSSPSDTFFDDVLSDLMMLASDAVPTNTSNQNIRLPQVHALNCLKDIIVNTKLGPYCGPHVSNLLDISVKSLGSPIWAVRNCGMMLFKALINRTSRKESSNTAEVVDANTYPRLSFEKYLCLIETLSSLVQVGKGSTSLDTTLSLDAFDDNSRNEIAFSILEIALHTRVSEDRESILRERILQSSASSLWLIRTKASRTLSTLIREEEAVHLIHDLLQIGTIPSNLLHGRLLCVVELVRKLTDSKHHGWEEDILGCLLNHFQRLSHYSVCPSPFVADITAINLVLEFIISTKSTENFDLLLDKLGGSFEKLLESITATEPLDPSKLKFQRHSSACLIRLETSIALAIFYLTSKRISALHNSVAILVTIDPDAACKLIETLNRIARTRVEFAAVVFEVFSEILSDEVPVDVQTAIMIGLANVLEDHKFQAAVQEIVGRCWRPSRVSASWESLLAGKYSNPQLFEASLRLRGSFLALEIQQSRLSGAAATTSENKIRAWACLLKFASDENNEPSTRLSAMLSLKAFLSHMLASEAVYKTDSCLLQVYQILYDFLSDDDEEIRDLAAEVVSEVVKVSASAKFMPIVPLAASALLSEFISKAYSDSNLLVVMAIGNLLSVNQSDKSLKSSMYELKNLDEIDSFEKLLSKARREDTSLFAAEKQNLFVDEVSTVETWARILATMVPDRSNFAVLEIFESWIHAAINVIMKSVAAEWDGPLGWTSSPEVFALGLRAIHGAGVLLCWQRRHVRDLSDPSLFSKLGELLAVGRRHALHEYWIQRIESNLG